MCSWPKAGKILPTYWLFLGQQMPSWWFWEVGKTKISCKEAGSVQYKVCRMGALPHAPQQIKKCIVDCAPQTVW